MLTFLRKMRGSFIDSGTTRKYLLYAIREILLVMIGILLALFFSVHVRLRLDHIARRGSYHGRRILSWASVTAMMAIYLNTNRRHDLRIWFQMAFVRERLWTAGLPQQSNGVNGHAVYMWTIGCCLQPDYAFVRLNAWLKLPGNAHLALLGQKWHGVTSNDRFMLLFPYIQKFVFRHPISYLQCRVRFFEQRPFGIFWVTLLELLTFCHIDFRQSTYCILLNYVYLIK